MEKSHGFTSVTQTTPAEYILSSKDDIDLDDSTD